MKYLISKSSFWAILSISILILACNPNTIKKKLVIINGFAQGTTYSISYNDSLGRNLNTEIDSILDEFNSSLSIYDSNSIISRINRNDSSAKPDYYILRVLEKSIEIADATKGAFDPTVGPLVKAWGFGFKTKTVLSQHKIDSILVFTGYKKISLNKNNITKQDPRIKLDFNAIAQGYSVDIVCEFLEKQNIHSYLVEIGGEVRVKGKKDNDSLWSIGIERPVDSTNTRSLKAIAKLYNKSIATSGNYRKFFVEKGVKYSHAINPFTGYPAKNTLLSATVIADDCMTADALATSFMIIGKDSTLQFIKHNKDKYPVGVYLIYSNEKGNLNTYLSPEMAKYIEEIE